VLINLAHIFHVSTDYLLGLNKMKTIDISGLDEKEINIIIQLIDLLKAEK
jgi:hypothetical protein